MNIIWLDANRHTRANSDHIYTRTKVRGTREPKQLFRGSPNQKTARELRRICAPSRMNATANLYRVLIGSKKRSSTELLLLLARDYLRIAFGVNVCVMVMRINKTYEKKYKQKNTTRTWSQRL